MKTNYNFKLKFISPGVFTCNGWTIYHCEQGFSLSKGSVCLDANDRDELDRLLSIHTTGRTRRLIARNGQNGKLI